MYELNGVSRAQALGLTARSGTLPPGDAGTLKTLGVMRGLATDGARDLDVRTAAIQVVRAANVPGHDHAGELTALFHFVRDRVRFTRDISGVETLQSPRATLRLMAGDCDDRATLLVAMARSIGVPAAFRFRAVAVDASAPDTFSHVYVVARLQGRDIAMDPTYSSNAVGYEPSRAYRRLEVTV